MMKNNALQIGASAFFPAYSPDKLDALLAALSPYQSLAEVLETFQDVLPGDRSCAVEAVLWACWSAVSISDMPVATRAQLLDFITRLGDEVDALHSGGEK